MPTALSVTTSCPLKMPIVGGVKPKVNVQFDAGASVPGQLLLSVNVAPLKTILLMLRLSLPRFVRTAVNCGAGVPAASGRNVAVPGSKATAGPRAETEILLTKP